MQTKRNLPNCGDYDQRSDKTKKCPNESNFAKCGERHMVGSNNYEIEIKERVNKKYKLIAEWEDEKFFKSWRVKMSLQDQTLNHNLATYFRYKMDPEKKIKFNPWAIEKSFTQ